MERAEPFVENRKAAPPDPSTVVPRPRLFRLLSGKEGRRLVFVQGQAAQGKTSLVASYLESVRAKPAWINLGVGDADPVNLLHALIGALESVLPGVDFAEVKRHPGLPSGPRDEAKLCRDWAEALLARVPDPVELVVDGLDALPADAPSLVLLRLLVEQASPNVRLWLLSRAEAPFDLARRRLAPGAVILDNRDLAFTREEIASYFRAAKGLRLGDDQAERVFQLTEGWAGGLVLLAEMIDRSADEAGEENRLWGELSSRLKTEAFPFFAAEILSRQPEPVRRLLVLSSVFETVEPSLARQLTGVPQAERFLQDLVRRNLFVQSIHDEKAGRVFRCHVLFRDYLRARFAEELGEDEQEETLARAGALFASRGDWEPAARLFLAAHREREAAAAVTHLGHRLLSLGRVRDLRELIELLPGDVVAQDAWLSLYLSITRRFSGASENGERLRRARDLFRSEADVRGQILALAFLIEASIFRGRDPVPMSALLVDGEALLKYDSVENHPAESATLWCQLGIGHILRGGDLGKGTQCCRNAYVLARSCADLPLQIQALAWEMLASALNGEFRAVDALSSKLERMVGRSPYRELRAMYLINLSQSLSAKGDLGKAAEAAAKGREIVENHGLLYLYPVALLTELMVRPQVGEFDRAEEAGRHLLELASALGIDFVAGLAEMFLGLNYYLKEDYPAARDAIERSYAIVSTDACRSRTHIMWNKVLTGLIDNRLGRFRRAEAPLTEALAHFETISSPLNVVAARLALALSLRGGGRTAEAAAQLGAGLKLADDRGIGHIIFLNRKDYLEAGRLAVESDLPGTRSIVSRLLAAHVPGPEMDEFRALAASSRPKARRAAREILKSVHRMRLPKLQIASLGGFSVSRGGETIPDREWGGILPRQMLKVIVARGGANVPRDLVMEDLWPEETKKASEANFKVNLHRLRKVLEPSLAKEIGSSYVNLSGNLVSLDPELWELDVAAFSDLAGKAEDAARGGRDRAAIAHAVAAAKLYRGDFLAEDLYVESIRSRREALRREYLELLHLLAGMQENRGQAARAAGIYRKIIAVDPVSETAAQRLMIILAGRGKCSEALRVYTRLEEALAAEVDAAPDEQTRRIHRSILQTGRAG